MFSTNTTKALPQIHYLTAVAFKFSFQLATIKRFLLNPAFATEILDSIPCILLHQATQTIEMFHSLQSALIYSNLQYGRLPW